MALKHVDSEAASATTIVSPFKGSKESAAPGDLEPAWSRGGRRADLDGDYDQRRAADADWRRQLARNFRQDNEAVGIPRALDGTPWVRGSRY